MYLRCLEIQGFKSFPEKTRLTFDKPITGIVGPNGSGKSNISDAILWVMGEQSSKTLRGGKMEDVIFGGTEKRAQVGFAEVSLIIDNSSGLFKVDASEVMITRRYYRSGESEYYINKKVVRLKDVNDLLMDTGLGREGYSIIGQGKIDAILSVKSADRREIFEEAAGISRFRHRKEESERKLQHTDENLVRINDKIAELELQVEPLREQAEVAKKYLVFRDELRGHEISVWTEELCGLETQSVKLKQDSVTAKQDLDKASAELDEMYKGSERFSEKMREKDIETEAVRARLAEVETQLSDASGQVRVLHANFENNAVRIEQIDQELNEHDGRDEGLKSQIEEREARIEQIAAARAENESAIAGILAENEKLAQTAGESSETLEKLFRAESEAVSAQSERQLAFSALASSAQEMMDRENTVVSELAALSERMKQQEAEMAQCVKEYDEVSEKAQSLKNVISGYTLRLDSRKKKSTELAETKNKLSLEEGSINSRIAMLREMERDFEGYSRAVKIVMQDAKRGTLKNIHGTVAGLIKVEDRFAVAIETALGASMQNIVVATEEDGKNAINMLRRRDGGRATFLPLSTIKGNVLNERGLESEAGFEGVALNLVGFDATYKGVFTSLLGRIVIVRNIDDAIAISRKYGNRFRLVTLDGQVINAGGSMTGGSTSRSSGVISRANELERLSEQVKLVSEKLADVTREHDEAVRELSAVEYELELAQSEMRELEDTIIRLASSKNHHELLKSAAEESRASLDSERSSLRARIEKNSSDTAVTGKEIKELEAKISVLRAEIADASQGQENLGVEKERLSQSLAELRAEGASLEAEREALENAVREMGALRANLSGGMAQQLELRRQLEETSDAIKAEIAEKEHELEAFEARIQEQKDRISAISAEKLELEAQRTRSDKDMQEKNRMLLDLERECARLEQKTLACEMEEKQLIDKLWDSYELTRSMAMETRTEQVNVPESKRRIAELRREISKLGNPNIGAIDEYERVNSRYTYLSEQRDDVEKAKRELLVIIADITEEMRVIFAREFVAINESFKTTFLELFGGGKASLELDDEEDILNCGIEIKVQPPGKTLKTLTLLSGGEKAFVAIALYFAILKVRPTPFVVMDEIEAALDEANVLRFAEYMRRMSDKSQMIVISHRRGTIEEADVLYGVTMQEQGISRVLTIDLEEAEKSLK